MRAKIDKSFMPHNTGLADGLQCKRNVYLQKRKAQGLMTIEQVAEWAPQYSLEIQRTIRYIGMKIIDENESVEKAHTILKI